MNLFTAARACLDAATPDDKPALTLAMAEAFKRGELAIDAAHAIARVRP